MAGKKKEIDLRNIEDSAATIVEYTAGAMKNAGFTEDEIFEMEKEIYDGYIAAHKNLIDVSNRFINEVNKRLEEKRRKKNKI